MIFDQITNRRPKIRTKKNKKSHPPPVVRPRLRVTRFVGGCSGAAVAGEVASDTCFLLRDAFVIAGVLLVDAGVDAAGTDAPDGGGCCCWGIVLCCFCGELLAEGGAFLGELMVVEGVGAGAEGFVTDAGALE